MNKAWGGNAMKKLLCVLMSAVLCLSLCCPAFASETSFCVETVAEELINDALTQPSQFGLPDLQDENVYICNAVNPYTICNDVLTQCEGIEYYLVKTDDAFIACITLCYDDGILISATLDLHIADVLNNVCSPADAIQLITYDGTVYVRTDDAISDGTASYPSVRSLYENNEVQTVATLIEDGPVELTVKSELTDIVTDPVIPRSYKVISVPYVSQEGKDICWAAAAAAFGRYYTGSTYSSLSASDLVAAIGAEIGPGTMADARKILSDVFNISTTYSSMQLTYGYTITLLQQSKPILAGFSGSVSATGEERGHMVVICGFDDSGTNLKFYVRDSNYTAYKTVTLYSRSIAMEYYDGVIMWWDEAAYKS